MTLLLIGKKESQQPDKEERSNETGVIFFIRKRTSAPLTSRWIKKHPNNQENLIVLLISRLLSRFEAITLNTYIHTLFHYIYFPPRRVPSSLMI